MQNIEHLNQKEVNQDTQTAHRREVLWQITIPFIIGLLAFLIIVVVVTIAGIQGNGQLSRWADTSLIWLILPALVIALIFIILFGGFLYLVIRLNNALPVYSYKIYNLVRRVQRVVEKGSNLAAEPVIKVESFRASIRALLGR
jgi:hypothetical protein